MPKYLYEQLQAKGLGATTLPLELAYSVAYNAQLDRACGTMPVTYKPIKINEN